MKYYSTNNRNLLAGFREAVIDGLPKDNGLYFPEHIPTLPPSFFNRIGELSLPEIALEVLAPFTSPDIDRADLSEILTDTLDFDIPLVKIRENTWSLELYHGPTRAFKDVGARFLARCLGYFSVSEKRKVTVLVATSGDTGSAVGQGFYGVPNVEVVILYPSGKVSPLQEKQLTTLGGNITALEIDGVFDDCQRMVKSAFLDRELKNNLLLTSANSINIARWLPQSVYYFWAYSKLPGNCKPIFSVPSGNYGNLTAGLLARAMGLNIRQFLAASNANKVIPDYLLTGRFNPAPSIATLSNAMDVGNPSNFPRMLEIYKKEFEPLTRDIRGFSFSDDQTIEAVRRVKENDNYLLDPHGAIGLLALESYRLSAGECGVFLETAHPAKFDVTMEHILNEPIEIPSDLKQRLNMDKKAIQMGSDEDKFKKWLLSR